VTSPHLTSPHLTSPHLTSSEMGAWYHGRLADWPSVVIWLDLTWPDLTWPDLTWPVQSSQRLRSAPLEKKWGYWKRLQIVGLLELRSIWVHCESRVAVAEARGQFGNEEEGARPLLQAGTRGLVKRQKTEKTQSVL
jgi:hypothetical protein